MKQKTFLYVLLGLIAFAGIASLKKHSVSFSHSQNERTEPAFDFRRGTPSEHNASSSESSSSWSPSSNSSSHSQMSFFETVYSRVADFLGFETASKSSSLSSSSSAADISGGGSGRGGAGGGGGGAGAGGGGSDDGGKKSGNKNGGGGGSSASKPGGGSGGDTQKGDDDDEDDEDDPSSLPGNQPLPDPIQVASEQAKNNFTSESHLAVPYPNDLNYRPLDIEDGVAAIHGYNTQTQVNLSLMAKAGTYGPTELQGFLEEYGSAIPGFKSAIIDNISESSADRPPAQSGSGLKPPYLWSMQLGSNTLTVALVQREDGQGTYLAVLSGPTSYIDNNEDKYDAIYNQIKANP